jgi:hypothetical protein
MTRLNYINRRLGAIHIPRMVPSPVWEPLNPRPAAEQMLGELAGQETGGISRKRGEQAMTSEEKVEQVYPGASLESCDPVPPIYPRTWFVWDFDGGVALSAGIHITRRDAWEDAWRRIELQRRKAAKR